ncbi:MAG: hypothetical protein ACMVO3_19220 [Thalassobaculum sp.]
MKVEDIPAGPGKTNLKAGEILVGFTFPPRPEGSSDAYLRMIPRTEMDIAVVGVGVSLTLDETAPARRPASVWAPSPRPCCSSKMPAKAIIGTKLDDAAIEKAAAACSRRLQSDRRQARHHRLTARRWPACLFKRTLAIAAERAEEGLIPMAKIHVSTTINGEPTEFLCDAGRHHAGRAARYARPDRIEGRLRHR